jgi:hypothetical protein
MSVSVNHSFSWLCLSSLYFPCLVRALFFRVSMSGMIVYLSDVAWLHVDALKPEIVGNQDFPASSGSLKGITLDNALDIIAKHFPKEVAAGVLPNNGSTRTLQMAIDASKMEKTFGFKFAGLEKQAVEIAEHYIELASKAAN